MRKGLSDNTSVGRAGAYKDVGFTETLLLPTVVARGADFWTHGERSLPLGGLACSPVFSRTEIDASWTGRSCLYCNSWGDVRVHLRSTLPGPLFEVMGRRLRLRFEFRNAPDSVVNLETRRSMNPFFGKRVGRALLLGGGRRPALLVSSSGIEEWSVTTHEHVELVFKRPGTNVMLVWLLNEKDVPSSCSLKHWLSLVERPPLRCDEEFEIEGDTVRLRQSFTDTRGRPCMVAPVPPLFSLVQGPRRILKIQKTKQLADTLLGPFCFVDGHCWTGSIDMKWRRSVVVPSRPVSGRLAPVPGELSYAGDVSWNPAKNPMDQLIQLTTWAQLAGITPAKIWKKLKPVLKVPTSTQLRKSLVVVEEPFLGRTYLKPAGIFGERVDASYDTDWYSGKSLAGMWRGLVCSDSDIRHKAEALVRDTDEERRLLQAYMEIYHDWALGSSWTDPRGEAWNLDCSHLGMSGVLGQEVMSRWVGDTKSADFSMYLAGKMATSFMAAYPLADWLREVNFVASGDRGVHLGIAVLYEWRGGGINGLQGRAHYGLAPDFPEFNALLRCHGPVDLWERTAHEWIRSVPQRYTDWEVFYTGRHGNVATKSMRQEDRTQAAVHYLVAPETALRQWTLGQDPDWIENLFRTPLPLSVQLWLRSAARLELA